MTPVAARSAPDDAAVAALVADARQGRRAALGRLLSLLENSAAAGRQIAQATSDALGGSLQAIGVTGLPGAGKSTMVSHLATTARRGGGRVAVLAVDPSSPHTGGALLGDRVRMDAHVSDESVFIRSLATRGVMGGLSRVVPQAIDLLDAVGYRVAIVETVGVGQVEVDIADEADTTVVVLNPGWGDWMQANKAGLLEVADILVMNKADRPHVREAVRDLERMLDDSETGPWRPPVVTTIGTTGEGMDELWAQLDAHREFLVREGLLDSRREARRIGRLRRTLRQVIDAAVEARMEQPDAREVEAAVRAGRMDAGEGADRLAVLVLGVLPADRAR